MKTSRWILLISLLLVVCLFLTFFLSAGPEAARAKITSNGKTVRIVDLNIDQSFTVENGDGYNIITVRSGKIAVTEASCPDHYCMHRGYCSSGAQIVCLPNRLVIEFLGEAEVDGAVG